MDNVNSTSQPLPSAKTSGLAIASLILGICGIFTCGLTAIIGLILGIVGLCAISKRAEQLKGQGLAIAGIIISAICIVLVPLITLMMAILMPAFSRAKMQGRNIMSMNNAKQICLAMAMYCEENEGRFPLVDNWPAALIPYLGDTKILESPFEPQTGLMWAMNKNLDGLILRDIEQPHRVVLIFEVEPGSPPTGGRELMPEGPRPKRGYVIGFLDGHVELVPPERLQELIWIPGEEKRPYDIIR